MEKRLLLAVFLSIGVLFVFQVAFAPKTTDPLKETQVVVRKDVKIISDAASTHGDTVTRALTTPVAGFSEEIYKEKLASFDVEFVNKGGNIQKLALATYHYDVPVRDMANLRAFENKAFTYARLSDTHQAMTYEGDGWSVVKDYYQEKPFVITTKIQIKNTSSEAKALDAGVGLLTVDQSRMDKKDLNADWTLFEYSVKTDKKMFRRDNAHDFNDKWNKEESLKIEWMGFRDRYFTTIVEPSVALTNYSVKAEGEKRLVLGGNMPAVLVQPGETIEQSFTIYSGPQKLDLLKQAKPGFEKMMVFSNWGWLDAISKAIYWLLGTLHNVLPVWGLCIILISLIVYGAMYPLTLKSLVSMKKMQAIQPKMAALKKKYEKNPEKMNQEVMALYKDNGVNPLSGCLPMILQMPIFVGLYQVLWRSIYFRGETFLWIQDLSMPDRLFKLPFSLPFLGEYFNILPILMAGIMFIQQKMNSANVVGADPDQKMQQKMLGIFMPVFLGFIFYNFSSGLNLYFVVFYTLSAYSQWHVSKNMKDIV